MNVHVCKKAFKYIHREKTSSNKTQALAKNEHLSSWYIKSTALKGFLYSN